MAPSAERAPSPPPGPPPGPAIDVDALRLPDGQPLRPALTALAALYAELEERAQALRAALATAGLAIPCGPGCDACCRAAVFVTPLEWWLMVDWLQRRGRWALLGRALRRGRRLARQHAPTLAALSRAPGPGEPDHDTLAAGLRFACPFLERGRCALYPARSLSARLFGVSFERPGVLYGCRPIEARLAGHELRLLNARAWVARLAALPLTAGRQVLPYYLVATYGPG